MARYARPGPTVRRPPPLPAHLVEFRFEEWFDDDVRADAEAWCRRMVEGAVGQSPNVVQVEQLTALRRFHAAQNDWRERHGLTWWEVRDLIAAGRSSLSHPPGTLKSRPRRTTVLEGVCSQNTPPPAEAR